ncbi:hypothetical protein EGH25_01545 [Haladaptatus sp. F3-133]|jgi:hypothetical protein|uniref:Uncharacterized protein n=1 Tax=Halorutilus salinus TaxID=2487751 RepID=A0A9Q4C310_9EURY|nr:hypothetical protein [Halorutilus salinus]MCX2818039.1 hypothetical protein [Halorutilus salinus]
MANETRSVKEVVPYVGIVALAFFIAGFLTFSLYNGVVNEVYPWPYTHFENNMTFFGAWMGAWVVAGVATGVYYGRK